jgi:hypothetical protein
VIGENEFADRSAPVDFLPRTPCPGNRYTLGRIVLAIVDEDVGVALDENPRVPLANRIPPIIENHAVGGWDFDPVQDQVGKTG